LRRSTGAHAAYLGEFYQCAGHQPDALLGFMDFANALNEALPKQLVEVIALTVAGVMENDYARNQHERRCLELGFSHGWVAAVDRLSPDKGAELSPAERAVQRYALAAVVRRGIGVDFELEALLDHLSSPEAMAVAMLVGCHVCQAMVSNTLALEPPVASIFDRADS
jgi:hypothetical protein